MSTKFVPDEGLCRWEVRHGLGGDDNNSVTVDFSGCGEDNTSSGGPKALAATSQEKGFRLGGGPCSGTDMMFKTLNVTVIQNIQTTLAS